jgi:teichuronic acid biosynthesis glycosyltransferase TuaC
LNILQLTHNYPSATHANEGIFIHRINKALAASCHITVILLHPGFKLPAIRNRYTLDGIEVVEVNYLRPRGRFLNALDGMLMLSTIPLLRRLISKVDIIHAHWQTDAGILGLYLSRKFEKPFIVSVRGARIFSKSSGSMYGRLSSLVFKKAARVHTHGQNILAQLLDEYDVPQEKTVLIPNIIFDRQQLRSLLEGGSSRNNPKNHFSFLFVGLDGKNKGLFDAVRSFLDADTGNHHFTIVTDTSSHYYQKRIKPLASGHPNITVLNKLHPDQVHSLFQDADVFLFPSYGEGFPNVVLEAMAAGCYIIGYDIPGLKNLVLHDRNGRLVKLNDISSLSREIHLFLSGRMNPEYVRYRENNRGYVEEHFDCDKITAGYLKMYETCVLQSGMERGRSN